MKKTLITLLLIAMSTQQVGCDAINPIHEGLPDGAACSMSHYGIETCVANGQAFVCVANRIGNRYQCAKAREVAVPISDEHSQP